MKNNFISIYLYFISILFLFFTASSVNAQPSAITDLRCVFSEMPGAVWLTWTPPAGAVSYEVRYALSPINTRNYHLAYRFPQNWPGTANQGLVDYLTENKDWFFAMKAIDARGNFSDISNTVWCFVPKKVIEKDETPPTSSISDPKDGAIILAGRDYIIKGISSDTGGSSVQKVEISFDDGKTWFLTKPKESIDRGFSWEYLWEKPVVGNYILKTKATDWWENKETPSFGIRIIVKELGIEKPKIEEKPIGEIAIKELETKILELQQKIIQVLKQLIQLLEQKIIQFQR